MVEILCTVTGVIAGIAVVASIMHQQGERSRFQAQSPAQADDTERIKGLADQLQMLTHRVAADVSAHTEKVVLINERLIPVQDEPTRILSAISELVEANEAMQGQLVAAQQKLNQQSRQIEVTARQARTDALTGLANRRALDEFLISCIQSLQPGEMSALLLLDIDHFKSFNDGYGHTTGDAVLASFARSILQWCDGRCYAARYGGEEFAVIFTGNSMESIARDAAQLRVFVSEQVIAYEDLRLTITSSGGLTEIKAGDTIQQVYERADEGLYRAKKEGRNCGYWLNATQWVRFESSSEGGPSVEQALHAAKHKNAGELRAQLAKAISAQSEIIIAGEAASDSRSEPHPDGGVATDILDLISFLERLEQHLEQLSRADLPATALMIHAVGIDHLAPQLQEECWSNVVAIIQAHLRGIDVLCLFRQHTLCIFMPGSSQNAAIDRASRMQHSLLASRKTATAGNPLPERFAVCVATAQSKEDRGAFMQRLEAALDEAHHTKATEIVVHDGNSIHTHSV
jgi:diguanylate cyclase